MIDSPKLLPGVDYLDFLAKYHEIVKPKNYFEIGTNLGKSFRLAKCPKLAVDPEFKLKYDPVGASPAVHLFQTTSDEFFQNYDLKAFLPGGVDTAFLDGLHLFEFLLRDFMNTEKCIHGSSVVFLHDCYPFLAEIADRKWNSEARQLPQWRLAWAGDVWKLLLIFREYRSDLEIHILDCQPTGLVVIRGMNSNSEVLKQNYDQILARFLGVSLREYGVARLHSDFPTLDSKALMADEAFRAFFRLPKT